LNKENGEEMSDKKQKDNNKVEPAEEQEAPRELNEVEALEAKLAESEAKVQELTDALMRERADFMNFRRRTDQDRLVWGQYAAGDVIRKMLAGIDDLERALAHKKDGDCSWAEGVDLVYRKFMAILESEGVKKIEAVGMEFDPEVHEALLQEPAEGVESGTVTMVLQPGYTHKDRVLRPAQVKVAQ